MTPQITCVIQNLMDNNNKRITNEQYTDDSHLGHWSIHHSIKIHSALVIKRLSDTVGNCRLTQAIQ